MYSARAQSTVRFVTSSLRVFKIRLSPAEKRAFPVVQAELLREACFLYSNDTGTAFAPQCKESKVAPSPLLLCCFPCEELKWELSLSTHPRALDREVPKGMARDTIFKVLI